MSCGQPRRLHPDTQALRDFITAGDAARYDNLPEGVVSMCVTHSNLRVAMADIRLDLHMTVDAVKEKLYTHSGTKPQHQRLILKTSDGQPMGSLDDDSRMLGYYGAESGMTLHIIDEDPFSLSRGGGLEDVSLVKKYTMSEEDYAKRGGTLREWIQQQKQKDPTWLAPWKEGDDPAKKEPTGPPPGPESVAGMDVGMRCECQPGSRRGTVMYLGPIEDVGEGYWVGVKFDEPLGRNDGTTKKGTRVFECPSKFGTFIRPQHVTVGDFPERSLLDDDEDEL